VGKKRGRTTQVRESTDCPACGARKGEPCRNYTGRNTRWGAPTVKGTPSPGIHAARWYEWMDGRATAQFRGA
jgi:hypothetical protein